MADNKPSNASCRDAADEADDIATPRSARENGLNTGASGLPVANSGTSCEPEGTEVLEHVASSTPVSTTTFRRFGSVDHRKLGSPLGMARLPPDIRPSTYQLRPHTSTAKQLDDDKPQPLPSSLTEARHVQASAARAQDPKHATKHLDDTPIANDLSPQTPERDRSLTPCLQRGSHATIKSMVLGRIGTSGTGA